MLAPTLKFTKNIYTDSERYRYADQVNLMLVLRLGMGSALFSSWQCNTTCIQATYGITFIKVRLILVGSTFD